MRLLITVDPEIPVPPINYGGIERIVDALVSAYTLQGHDVYLLANPESNSKNAKCIFGWKRGASRGVWNVLQNAIQLYNIVRQIKPDVIHSFSRLMYLYPNLLNARVPVLMTYQREISPKSTTLASVVGRRKIHFSSCGAHMLNHLISYRHKFTPIHNFTPVDYFTPDDSTDKEFLMFLGRIEDIKGTKEAIEVALATNNKLLIAGNIQPGHDDYFNTYVKPYLNNPLIEYVGPVNDEQKRYYLQRSKAFLFPIKWEEPFGIVMVEAMACGVPVIGFNRGSVPEVVKNGVTGFIVEDVIGMVQAVNKIGDIDRNEVRKDCVERFSLEVIAKQYLDLLQNLSR